MTVELPPTADTLTGQTVTLCRNDECHSAVLPKLPTTSRDEELTFAGTSAIWSQFYVNSDQKGELYVEWRAKNHDKPKTRDRYILKSIDTSGNSTTLLDKTATYERLSPNGDDCGPICWYANLTP
ncbi:MAG: hypothetical protein QM784_17530 [Polyangiaceae bacterium]